MLWWFERDGRQLRIEVLELPTGSYELCVHDPAAGEQAETFATVRELARRQHDVQDSLFARGWSRAGKCIL